MDNLTRVHRIPVIHKSRAGISYITYKDPNKGTIPKGFMNQIVNQKTGKIRLLHGENLGRGHYRPKPHVKMVLTAEGKHWKNSVGRQVKTIPRKYLRKLLVQPPTK